MRGVSEIDDEASVNRADGGAVLLKDYEVAVTNTNLRPLLQRLLSRFFSVCRGHPFLS
jgi:hypothetical protein